MDRLRSSAEQAQIVQMLSEIGSTPSGAPALEALQRLGFRVRFGRPLGGGAFIYPWRVITLRRGYSYQVTLGMLAHELGHVLFMSNYKRLWSGSVEQEYAANRFWAQVSSELGNLSGRLEAKWLGPDHDAERLFEEIRSPSAWHRRALPLQQRFGPADKAWAMWQAIASVSWVVSKVPAWRSRLGRGRARTRDAGSRGRAG
jgi:hypothetical protein